MENNLLNKKKQKFGIYEAALATLLFIIYNFIFSVVYTCLPDWVTANEVVNFVANFLLSTTFALTAITVACTRKIDILKATGIKQKKINGRMVWLCFWISLVSIIGFGDITTIFMEILYAFGYKSVLPDMAVTTVWQYIGYVLVTCMTPAFCEEFLFRGTILSGLKQYGGKVAVLCSALIFTFMHGNAEQTVHQFIVGVLIGYVFYRSGNLWLGVLIHFFNNFIAITASFLVSLLSSGETVSTATTVLDAGEIIYSLISTAIFVAFGYYLVRMLIEKLLREDEFVNSKVQESLNLQPIVVDGQEQVVEMVIEGEAVSNNENQVDETMLVEEKKESISTTVIVLFALSGLYLVGNWMVALLAGLGV